MANLMRIKTLAESRKISVRELAERVGVKENQIHVMCRTNSTKIDTLERIAQILGVPISYFFDEPKELRQAGRDYVERGNIEHNGGATDDDFRERIAELKSQLADKERIIKMMEEKS